MSITQKIAGALGFSKPEDANIKTRIASAAQEVSAREKAHADARDALEAAEAERTKLEGEVGEAEQAYADAPTDAKAKAVMKARESRDLAALRCSRPAQVLARAEAELGTARDALAALEAEQAEIEHRARVEALRAKATPAAFRTAAAPHVAALLEAIERAKSVAAAIEAELAATRAAAAELTQLGEPTTPPAAFHPALAVAIARIGTGAPVPHNAHDFVCRLQQMIARTHEEGGVVGLQELISASLDAVTGAARPFAGEEYRARVVDELHTLADCPTLHAGSDALQARRDAARRAAGVTSYAERDGLA